jgi:NAD(P)-dependent dehydrogenase (short-subunit alcohol dehydrogenase family)
VAPRFESKIIVVTGGSSGIGRAVAERVASEGAAVVIGSRREETGESVAAGIRAAGGQAAFLAADLTVEDDAARLIRFATEEFGRLDGAFNNVGGVNAAGRIADVDAVAWHAEIDHNLTSTFYSLKYELPAISATGPGGAIVNNASVLGVTGSAGMSAYAAAKHGVVGLTRAAALEFAAAGVRVNALVTHAVDTPMFRGMLNDPPDDALAAALSPIGRFSSPVEVAAFAAFLLSDEAAFITGAALAIDGGYTAR